MWSWRFKWPVIAFHSIPAGVPSSCDQRPTSNRIESSKIENCFLSFPSVSIRFMFEMTMIRIVCVCAVFFFLFVLIVSVLFSSDSWVARATVQFIRASMSLWLVCICEGGAHANYKMLSSKLFIRAHTSGDYVVFFFSLSFALTDRHKSKFVVCLEMRQNIKSKWKSACSGRAWIWKMTESKSQSTAKPTNAKLTSVAAKAIEFDANNSYTHTKKNTTNDFTAH